ARCAPRVGSRGSTRTPDGGDTTVGEQVRPEHRGDPRCLRARPDRPLRGHGVDRDVGQDLRQHPPPLGAVARETAQRPARDRGRIAGVRRSTMTNYDKNLRILDAVYHEVALIEAEEGPNTPELRRDVEAIMAFTRDRLAQLRRAELRRQAAPIAVASPVRP